MWRCGSSSRYWRCGCCCRVCTMRRSADFVAALPDEGEFELPSDFIFICRSGGAQFKSGSTILCWRTLDPGGNITIKWDVMHWNDDVMHCLKLRPIQFSLFEANTNFLGISLDVEYSMNYRRIGARRGEPAWRAAGVLRVAGRTRPGRGEENLPGVLLVTRTKLGAARTRHVLPVATTTSQVGTGRRRPIWDGGDQVGRLDAGPSTARTRHVLGAGGGDEPVGCRPAATKLSAWTRGRAQRGPGTCWGPAAATSQVGVGPRRPSWPPGRGGEAPGDGPEHLDKEDDARKKTTLAPGRKSGRRLVIQIEGRMLYFPIG